MFHYDIRKCTLLPGPHEFPDAGMCVTEAAVLAGGFKYRLIMSANDCPPCFSRPITAYAIALNDRMPDDLRQELLFPFVTRLADTADTEEIEHMRAEFMALETCRRLLSLFCDEIQPSHAKRLRNIRSLKEAVSACGYRSFSPFLKGIDDIEIALAAAESLAYAIYEYTIYEEDDPEDGARTRLYFTIGTRILNQAIRFGKHHRGAKPRSSSARPRRVMA